MRHRVVRRAVRVSLADACCRVLVEDIRAASGAPAFDRSLFDGYAVCAADVKRPGAALRIIEEISAGRPPRKAVKKGTCAAIATGAMLPRGADAVVKREDAWLLSGDCAVMRAAARKSENFTQSGSYFKKGRVLLKRGTVLDAARIGLLASQGVTRVRVFSPPRVAVLSTGDEIVEAGGHKQRTQIWNASAPMLLAVLESLGVEGRYLGCVKDEPGALKKKLAKGLRDDILIVTGAVSVGEKDHVPAMFKRLGVRIIFHKVRIRPGKPMLFGARGRHAVFGLPGNAVSSLVTFFLFVRPFIERFKGLPGDVVFEEGTLAAPAGNASGRLSFVPGRLARRGGKECITPVHFCDSSDLRAAADADAFFVLKETQARAGKGTVVPFFRIPR